MSDNEKPVIDASATLRAKRADGMGILGGLHMHRRALLAELERTEAKLAVVEAEIDGIDRSLTVV